MVLPLALLVASTSGATYTSYTDMNCDVAHGASVIDTNTATTNAIPEYDTCWPFTRRGCRSAAGRPQPSACTSSRAPLDPRTQTALTRPSH